jgi:ABC-type bacteriocin/lantibiotic exporter with double-glycine peptidase domain
MSDLFKYTKDILNVDRSTVVVILIYSLFISLLTLALPVAAQTLVNLVSFGTLVKPIFMLTIIVFIVLAIGATIKLAQAITVENIQQSIFANITLRFATHLNQIKFANFRDYRGPELVNRFFEVVTVQKTTGIIFLTMLDIVLQATFSMLVLAFYHPFLLAFDIALIVMMTLVIIIPYKGALKAAIDESDNKYEVAAWLDEITQNPLTFRVDENEQYALQQIDNKLYNYVSSRQSHFKYILKHLIGVSVVYVVGNTALLGIGGYLVINGQLSLGQLVAAELLVNIILTGFVKLGGYLRDYYDLMAGVLKLTKVLHLSSTQKKERHPIDKEISTYLQNFESLKVERFLEKKPGHDKNDAVNFEIKVNQKVLLNDRRLSRAKLLMDQIFSFDSMDYLGKIYINGTDIKLFDPYQVREYFSIVRGFEIFSGTIMDNLCLDREEISIDDLKYLINIFNLTAYIDNLPQGYDTEIAGHAFIFNIVFLQKISIIRALLGNPKLLILENSLDIIPEDELKHILVAIDKYASSLIVTTQRKRVEHYFEKVIEL